jgi:hypothetical protein
VLAQLRRLLQRNKVEPLPHTIHKNKLKINYKPKWESKKTKYLKGNLRIIFCDLRLGKTFSNRIPKTQEDTVYLKCLE